MNELNRKDDCACTDTGRDFPFKFAFQPVVNVVDRTVYSHEALIRGPKGEPAGVVLNQMMGNDVHWFDQQARAGAIRAAKAMQLQTRLNINFLPNSIYNPATCLSETLKAADECGFPQNLLVFEVTEAEPINQPDKIKEVFDYYKEKGFLTAIDDFGSGYAGLNLLAEFVPHIIKIDMELIRNIHTNPIRQSIVKSLSATARDIGIEIIAEGIESVDELSFLHGEVGIHLFQGYYFARPSMTEVFAPNNPPIPAAA